MSVYLECDKCGNKKGLYGWIASGNCNNFSDTDVRKRVESEREWYFIEVNGRSKSGVKTDIKMDICDQCINKILKKIGAGEVRQ